MSNAELETARDILDTMLGYLGFVTRIEVDDSADGKTLQVLTEEADLLIGKRGERLDDIQYLLNRLLHARGFRHSRIRVDIEHFRSMKEDEMLERVRELADRVRRSGRAIRLRPMNSYHRRLVHNAFKGDPDIKSWSPDDRSRMKRITLMPRKADTEAGPSSDTSAETTGESA